MSRPFRHDIVRAKGLAIFLVVLGHLVTGVPPIGNDWYATLRTAIYAFHMPFFMYLSGYIFYYADSLAKARAAPGPFLLDKAQRLLLPFLIFGFFIVFGKHAAGTVIHVDNRSADLSTDILNLFWHTHRSAAHSIWYVFVLFELIVITLVASVFTRTPAVLLLVGAVLMPFYALVPFMYGDRLLLYGPFFYLGGVCALAGERWLALIDRRLLLFVAAFAAALIATRIIQVYLLSIALCGALAAPALHGLVRRQLSDWGGALSYLGGFSYVIYLLNTIVIGTVKGVGFRIVRWDGPWFLLYFPLMLVAGLLVPIAIKRFVFRRQAFVDRITS